MANKGFNVVMEGQRIILRVYRRLFNPISRNHKGQDFIVYSDTRIENEINYKRSEDYDLDDPFKRISLIRLARAMNCLRADPDDSHTYHVTICTNRELYEPEAEEIKYIPFEPKRLKPLNERIRDERKKIDWMKRMKS
jgi:hypothetical protein